MEKNIIVSQPRILAPKRTMAAKHDYPDSDKKKQVSPMWQRYLRRKGK